MAWCICSLLFWLSATLAAIAAATRIYMKLTSGWCRSKTCLVGKTAIVTGANTGIGYYTALDFAMRGAKVILACRDRSRAAEAREKIVRESGNENVVVKILDLASFKSVRDFAKDVNETEERLDILVNNAGIRGIGDVKSEDGHLLVMQSNHLSGYLLTHLLIDLLKKSGPSRIVNVSSLMAKYADSFDVDKIDVFEGHRAEYNNSKLCNILFTKELARRLQGTGVTAYSLHPGVVQTEITKNFNTLEKFVSNLLLPLFKTSEEGAQTNIYTAVAPGIEIFNGENFHDCQKVEPYKTVVPGLGEKVWKKTEEIIKMKPEEIRI